MKKYNEYLFNIKNSIFYKRKHDEENYIAISLKELKSGKLCSLFYTYLNKYL